MISFCTIPVGASVTIQSKYDAGFAHVVSTKGAVINDNPMTNLYADQLDNFAATVVLLNALALFENVIVYLCSFMAQELGVFLVTLLLYWEDGGLYQASYSVWGGFKKVTTLRPQQFIVPNCAVVRLAGLGAGMSPSSRKRRRVLKRKSHGDHESNGL